MRWKAHFVSIWAVSYTQTVKLRIRRAHNSCDQILFLLSYIFLGSTYPIILRCLVQLIQLPILDKRENQKQMSKCDN
jgi:hypothetical protein